MSRRIPDETIQDILNRVEIVDVIGDYVTLTQRGANAKGLCPFHQEKTPSFAVSPAKGLFYCFGCQASGNAVRFLMMTENIEFPEAVRMLADRYGIRIPEGHDSKQDSELQQLYRLHQAAMGFFVHRLAQDPGAQAVREYCRARQLSREVVERFALGYAPNTWELLGREMQRQGYPQDVLVRSGLVATRDHRPEVYDRFRHRLMFPIHDRQGCPIAFGGRLLDGSDAHQAPKYLNSPETPIFQKNRTLYGFHLAKQAVRQHGQVIIVEGYTDVIACHRQGVTHVVGTLGTALTETHANMLKGLTKDVVLVFDGDTAGGKAAERGIGLFLDAGVRVRVVTLPEGEDPDTFLRQYSGEAFLQRVAEAQSFLEFLLTRIERFSDLRTPTGRADCVARVVPMLKKIESEVERWGYMVQLAEHLGMPPEVLEREMNPGAAKRFQPESRPASYNRSSHNRSSYDRSSYNRSSDRLSPPQRSLLATLPAAERFLVQELCDDLSALGGVQQQIAPDDLQNAHLRTIYAVLLQHAAQWQDTAFPHILQVVTEPTQAQILTEMALEPSDPNPEARQQALHDYVAGIQASRCKAEKRRVIERIRSSSGEQERDLLLELQRLQKGEEVGLPES
ncbi:DNA primase [Candidatus Entotheonella serta]|nr:DNA primase [Candidatus Entotheonella serta]